MDVSHAIVKRIIDNVEKVIIGKTYEAELALVALLSEGHLLIEDVPGVGKTMLAKSIAKSIGCNYKRIQFTPDLLPSDVTGVSIYNQKNGDFEFRPGPIVAQIVLADEINRATPKTQSALLESMEERQMTIDGTVYKMPRPFMVMATQNPIEYEGTFPLPEAQLDRFLLRISLGYPTVAQEVAIMERQQRIHPIEELEQVVDIPELLQIQEEVKQIYIDSSVKEYIATIAEATRQHRSVYLGASPRGSLALFRTAQARALIQGRDFVLPDDIKALAVATLAHRVIISPSARVHNHNSADVVSEVIDSIPVPGSRVSKPTRN